MVHPTMGSGAPSFIQQVAGDTTVSSNSGYGNPCFIHPWSGGRYLFALCVQQLRIQRSLLATFRYWHPFTICPIIHSPNSRNKRRNIIYALSVVFCPWQIKMEVLNINSIVFSKSGGNKIVIVINVSTRLTNLSDQQFHYCRRKKIRFEYSAVIKR